MRSNWHYNRRELYLKGGFIAKSTQRSHPHVICAFARSIMIIVLGQNSKPKWALNYQLRFPSVWINCHVGPSFPLFNNGQGGAREALVLALYNTTYRYTYYYYQHHYLNSTQLLSPPQKNKNRHELFFHVPNHLTSSNKSMPIKICGRIQKRQGGLIFFLGSTATR